jgi:hypothetical protein
MLSGKERLYQAIDFSQDTVHLRVKTQAKVFRVIGQGKEKAEALVCPLFPVPIVKKERREQPAGRGKRAISDESV